MILTDGKYCYEFSENYLDEHRSDVTENSNSETNPQSLHIEPMVVIKYCTDIVNDCTDIVNDCTNIINDCGKNVNVTKRIAKIYSCLDKLCSVYRINEDEIIEKGYDRPHAIKNILRMYACIDKMCSHYGITTNEIVKAKLREISGD